MIIARLDAQDIVMVTVIAVTIVALVAITVALMVLVRTLATVRAQTEALRVEADALLGEMAAVLSDARGDLERVDDLVGSAEALAATVDGAAKVGYFTVGKPVIKTVALAKGTSRAARRIRGTKAS